MAETQSIVVRIAQPAGRPIQLWYRCPSTGKQIRKSADTRNLAKAEQQRELWEARLRLGIGSTGKGQPAHAEMSWQDFREEYSRVKLFTGRDKSAADAESRLDIAERIMRPRALRDLANGAALHQLQTKLLSGAAGKKRGPDKKTRPRSCHTVRGYMRAVLAALRWAKLQGWLDSVPAVELVSTDESDDMKGRPLVGEEVDRLLLAVGRIIGAERAESWRFLLRAVVASGLRLAELMQISWNIPQTIQPVWRVGALPVLSFPGHLQKNKKTQEIPLCPWLEELLDEVPPEQRTGWIFNPQQRRGKGRLCARHVGSVISRIGKQAGVIVDEGNPRTGAGVKYASCHDLRRTFATKLYESDLPPELIRKLMRHSDIRTTERFYLRTNTQRDAGKIREFLGRTSSQHTGSTQPPARESVNPLCTNEIRQR